MRSKKVGAIRNLLPPVSVKKLQYFGSLSVLSGLYAKVCAYCSSYDLTKLLSIKEFPFVWTSDCEEFFKFLKNALCSSPILTCYDRRLTLVLDMQSAILGMKNPKYKREHVIEYASRSHFD